MVEEEYQIKLWREVTFPGTIGAPIYNFSCEGKVCFFDLRLNHGFKQGHYRFDEVSTQANLLSDNLFASLNSLLFPPEISVGSNQTLTSLVILSPIPVVLANIHSVDGVVAWSGDAKSNTLFKGTGFADNEVGKLLDLLTKWLNMTVADFKGAQPREVFIICGGSYANCSSVIRIDGASADDYNTDLCIKQLCCGSFIGIAPDLDGIGVGSNWNDSYFEGSFSITSPSLRKYLVTSIRNSLSPQVGVVTLGEILKNSPSDDSVVSNTAGCFHLNLHDLKLDAQGLGHEILPMEVFGVWQKVKQYLGDNELQLNSSSIIDVVYRAVLKLCADFETMGTFRECHKMFRSGIFGSINREGDASSSEERVDVKGIERPINIFKVSQGNLMFSTIKFLMDRLSGKARYLMPSVPSELVLRLVWQRFADINVSTNDTQNTLAQAGLQLRRDDIAYASLCSSEICFSRLCMDALIALALFPHCALDQGLCDV